MPFLNQDSLSLNIFEYVDESFSSLPLKEFKYKRWDWALQEGVHESVRPLLLKMLDLMPPDKDLRWLVDYKVRDLKAGDCGCVLEGWHLDVVTDPNHNTKPDFHLIYSTEVGTDFLTNPIYFDKDVNHFKKGLEIYNDEYLESQAISAKPNWVSAYNRFQLHRGPRIMKNCRRMLLRVTATQVIK